MVSSLMDVQYHDDQFWMFTESPDQEGIANDYDTPRNTEFNEDFEAREFGPEVLVVFLQTLLFM